MVVPLVVVVQFMQEKAKTERELRQQELDLRRLEQQQNQQVMVTVLQQQQQTNQAILSVIQKLMNMLSLLSVYLFQPKHRYLLKLMSYS